MVLDPTAFSSCPPWSSPSDLATSPARTVAVRVPLPVVPYLNAPPAADVRDVLATVLRPGVLRAQHVQCPPYPFRYQLIPVDLPAAAADELASQDGEAGIVAGVVLAWALGLPLTPTSGRLPTRDDEHLMTLLRRDEPCRHKPVRRYTLHRYTDPKDAPTSAALKAFRLQLGLTQDDLAARTGVTKGKVNYIENRLTVMADVRRQLWTTLETVEQHAVPA